MLAQCGNKLKKENGDLIVGPVNFSGRPGCPNETNGEHNWYNNRKTGDESAWTDDYYLAQYGVLKSPKITVSEVL